MAREISPICDFIFRSIRTSLLTDMLDVDPTIQAVKGIYMYRKVHTAESMMFTPWSKKVIPFPSLRKYKLFRMIRDRRQQCHGMMAVHFSSLPLPTCLETQEREPLTKIRTKWSGRNRFNPIKTRRANTPETKMSDLDKIDTDIKAPKVMKACDTFGLSCSYCEQGALHSSPEELDWSSKDWDGTKARAKEDTNSLMDYNMPKPLTDIDQMMDVNEIAFSKL